LSAGHDDDVPRPHVDGLETGDDPSFLGIIVSHGHLDHYGLIQKAHPDIPVYMGEAAARLLAEAAFFLKNPVVPRPTAFLHNGVAIDIGPFRVTPHLVDHSAFDAYALEVEAGGYKVFYTGDFRGHGRKAALFQRLLDNPPKNVDLMLCEATNVRGETEPEGPVWTESDLEDRFVKAFQNTNGLALVAFSVQNIDRLVTIYRAARRAGRNLAVDLYAATVARATGLPSIPQPPSASGRFDGYRIFVPRNQSVLVKGTKEFDRVEWVKGIRVYPEEIAAHPEKFVLLFRGSMMGDLRNIGGLSGTALSGASAWWSLWKGYLDEPSGQKMKQSLASLNIPLDVLHTSGHASVADLRRLRDAVGAAEVRYIHTEHPDWATLVCDPR
jgi:ribonuclease J